MNLTVLAGFVFFQISSYIHYTGLYSKTLIALDLNYIRN